MKSIQNTNQSSLNPIENAREVIKLEQLKRQVDDRLQLLRTSLMDKMIATDVLTLKTGSYTITRVKRTTIRITDDREVKRQLEEEGHQVITKEIIDMKYMKPLVASKVDELDGAEKQETEYISIRMNKGKK